MSCPDSLRRILAVARAEWTHNYRDARSLGIIVALPLVLLLLYGYAINFDVREVRFAVQDWDRSRAGADFVESMVRSEYFALAELVEDTARLENLVERGRVLLDHLRRDLADVGAAVAVGGGRLALGCSEQRQGEPVDLHPGVVEVVLAHHAGIGGLEDPAERVADGDTDQGATASSVEGVRFDVELGVAAEVGIRVAERGLPLGEGQIHGPGSLVKRLLTVAPSLGSFLPAQTTSHDV